jgi:predicted kinase
VLASDASSTGQRRIHIEVDAIFALLLPDSGRSREDRMLAYDAAHVLARMLLDRGKTVVLECTYARLDQRASLLDALAHLQAAPLWVVEVAVSADDAVRRFRQRHEATDLDELLVRERAEAFPYFEDALRLESSTATPGALAREITEWLRHKPPSVNRDLWATAGRA